MMRSVFLKLFALLLALPAAASAMTLDEVFANFQRCEFQAFYYSPWDASQPVHPYFAERNLTPYKEVSGVYYFSVKDTLFDLPVAELIVPGTWDVHGVIFNISLAEARTALKHKFGDIFAASEQSAAGLSPALDKFAGSAGKSILYCSEKKEEE